MRFLTSLVALAALCPAALAGQARYSAAFGFLGGTKLAEDRIFQGIRLTQARLTTVTLGASLPVSERERAGLEVGLAFGQSRIRETGFPVINGPSYKTLSITAGVEGPIIGPVRYRGGAGLMKYLADKEGIFRQGAPLLLVLTFGSDVRLVQRGSVGLVARVRYDYHRFATDELQSSGFARTQDVHRIGVGLGIEYSR